MTEAEWLASTDPTRMLDAVKASASDRKLRLFALACGERVADARGCEGDLADARLYLEDLAKHADGLITPDEWDAAVGRVLDKRWEITDRTPDLLESDFCTFLCALGNDPFPAALYASVNANIALSDFRGRPEIDQVGGSREALVQSPTFRDIFGNPFRPVTLDPAWLTSTVAGVAQGIYHDRAFDRLPILADALQDAGCVDEQVLGHCRGEGPHVRGCWVVDLLTGRT